MAPQTHCKTPTDEQLEAFLRKKPIWLADCPNPLKEKRAPCQCLFTADDLDPKKGWTKWRRHSAPDDFVEIPGTEGDDLPQSSACRFRLTGTYEESSKILHGVCVDTTDDPLPKEMKEALDQRNPREPPRREPAPPRQKFLPV